MNFTQTQITKILDEIEYTNKVTLAVGDNRIHNTAGILSLKDLLNLIRNSQMMISNDSGPMHLAFALGTTTIGLFGPCNPIHYNIPDSAIIFYKQILCSPCVHNSLRAPCKGNNRCMKEICVEEVFEKALILLESV